MKNFQKIMLTNKINSISIGRHDKEFYCNYNQNNNLFLVSYTSCGRGMNHGVVLIGFKGNEKAWNIRNSWGTSWGEGGHIRLIRGSNMCNMLYRSSIPLL